MLPLYEQPDGALGPLPAAVELGTAGGAVQTQAGADPQVAGQP